MREINLPETAKTSEIQQQDDDADDQVSACQQLLSVCKLFS